MARRSRRSSATGVGRSRSTGARRSSSYESDAGGGPLLFAVADAMATRGWLVQPQLHGHGAPASLHLTISAGHLPVVDRFLADLRWAVAQAQAAGTDPGLAMLLGAAGSLDFASLGDEGFTQALALVGVRDGTLPERMAPIHTLLDTLPPAVREAALLAFLNDLYTAHGAEVGSGGAGSK